jgi:ferredoxin
VPSGESLKIRADVEKCQGFANCVMAAPEVFDLNDESLVVVDHDEVGHGELEQVQEAVRSCPVGAIWLSSS